ncbi:MAG: hypothetical protein K6D03_11035 [Solobacterium sp.]|nr:hypothetical protein [Solobacterium sp.]
MAKKVKRNKRKTVKLQNFAVLLFAAAIVCYLASALFLRTYNNSLSTEVQAISAKITTLQVQNDAVAVEVNNLSSRDRVSTIAGDDGLQLDQTNIVTITKTDGE